MTERFICHNQFFCILFFFFFFFFFFFLYFNVFFQVNCSSSLFSSSPNKTHHRCSPKDHFALLQFKSAISVDFQPHYDCPDNSYPKTASWAEDSDCCSWNGVTCDEETANVIGLDLDCSWLEGTIQDNSSLFHLSHLHWLNLAFNNFSDSQTSPQFGRLTELTQLNLSCSQFKGLVPSEISHLTKLTLLDLSSCASGCLTINQKNFDLLVHNLTKLSVLNLEMMNMSSVKPFPLLNLSRSMTILDLGDTGIQGKLPEELFCLPKLRELYLHGNTDLTGYLPKSNWSSDLRVLHLYSSNFKGEIPASIGNLKFLEVLFIGSCNITGSIPTSIGNLNRVAKFDLSGNMLTGQIPDVFVNFSLSPSGSPQLPHHVNVLPHLSDLLLSDNFLNGRVPSWLFTLPSLVYIDLSNNKLTGPIDQLNLGLANSLREVYLGDNEIHGSIPTFMFELVNLTYLDISSNSLDGTVKFDMLSKLKNLELLDLSNNSLLSVGSSSCINCSLPSLQFLMLSFCNISEFPSFLRTSEKLEALYLSNNKIHGGIAKSKSEGGWKSLASLDLSNNFLTYIEQHPWKKIQTLDLRNNVIQGSILVPPPSTVEFLVSNNKMSGQIPPSICYVSNLQFLDLSNNNLSGQIPSCLGSFRDDLLMLQLRGNNFRGSIPDTFPDACLLKSLDLSDNKLDGLFPKSLVHCSHLVAVNVGNNNISDSFPCWLATFQHLKILVLRSNRFYGPICFSVTTFPFSNLQIIDLSHNQFTGSLPGRFFASMEELMNKDNHVSTGEFEEFETDESVNVSMKGGEYIIDRKSLLVIFTSIDLSRNWFQGEIPEIFGKFKSLVILNLSHNSLTGHIPVSFSNLTALESLDLSFNKLDGSIPDQLISVTTLAALNLSYNRLWGPIPRGNQFNTFANDSFIGNKGLCGPPLSVKCGIDGAAPKPSSSSVSREENQTATGFDRKIVMMGYASGLVIGFSIGYIVFSTGKPLWFVRMVEERLITKVRRSSQRRRRTNK